jgi:aspartyl-tRNA(Asn)/glutamyl-tRNA(Gln) amidotransferase subunit A
VAPDNTFFCNYFGLPAISVPSGLDLNGLPLGLQLVGPHGGDHDILAIARAYQLNGVDPRGTVGPPR